MRNKAKMRKKDLMGKVPRGWKIPLGCGCAKRDRAGELKVNRRAKLKPHTHEGYSHLICYKHQTIYGLIFISSKQKRKECILGLSIYKEK